MTWQAHATVGEREQLRVELLSPPPPEQYAEDVLAACIGADLLRGVMLPAARVSLNGYRAVNTFPDVHEVVSVTTTVALPKGQDR